MKSQSYIIRIATALIAILSILPAHAERRWLITSHSQLSTNTTDKQESEIIRIGLTDGDSIKDCKIESGSKDIGGAENNPWESADISGHSDDCNYIQVSLNNPLSLSQGEYLVVYTKRHTLNGLVHPTGFRIEASHDEKNWKTVSYAYLIYRGINTTTASSGSDIKGTKEYSSRLSIDTELYSKELGGEINYLRFYVTANNTKQRVLDKDTNEIATDENGGLTENRSMKLASFNVMVLTGSDPYSDILTDRFHLVTDFSYKYYYYDFIPTLGIFDSHNQTQNVLDQWNNNVEINSHLKDYTIPPGNGDSPWEESESGIRWKKDLDILKAVGIGMPEYNKLTNAFDDRISKSPVVPHTDTENWRQPVHEYEHILYAIPGDPIALYPFYGMSTLDADKYCIRFVHWYNYRTGGNSPYLDFLINPALVCKSEKYGYYGGSQISQYTKKSKASATEAGSSLYPDYDVIPDIESLKKKLFEKNPSYDPQNGDIYSSNNLHKVAAVGTFFFPRRTNPELKGELGLLPPDSTSPNEDKDYIIAADMSTFFYNNDGTNIDYGSKKIHEPTVTFRHIFRIKDGKKFADDFSGSKKANDRYILANRKIISARSKAQRLQIRLDCPVPIQKDKELPPPSKYYYKISPSDYRRVRSFELVATKVDEHGNYIKDIDPNNEIRISFNENDFIFDGQGSRAFDNATYNICGGGGRYSRMILCEGKYRSDETGWNEVLPVGHYRILLLGLDINGNRIKIFDPASGKPGTDDLVVQRFDLEILSDNEAQMLEKSEALKSDLGKIYGSPTAEINFDKYATLLKDLDDGIKPGIENKNDYLVSYSSDKYGADAYLKWPLKWKESTYGFGYSLFHNDGGKSHLSTLDFNYNIYLIANNFTHVPWHESSTGDGAKYDVSFYKKKEAGLENPEKGFFFWMNSASDPCVAARIELDQLCTGSMIHVSTWIQETSNGSEKGNISFNFNAIATTGERVLIHSFKTGAVPDVGKWYNVRYQFMPDFDRIAGMTASGLVIDHYEMELENNCKNSEKADYAIDEIQIYVVAPQVAAKQLEPICDAPRTTRVKITLPFAPFLASLGIDENHPDHSSDQDREETVNVYYSFIDKAVFDKELIKSGYQSAFEKAVLRYNYDGSENHDQYYGKLSFSNRFENNTLYPGDDSAMKDEGIAGNLYGDTDKSGVKNLVIVAEPENRNYFAAGQQYYIAIFMDDSDSGIIPGPLDFDVSNNCSSKGIFSVESSNKVLISQGNSEYELPAAEYCLGTSPSIKIDLREFGKDDDVALISNAGLDWYAGSLSQFQEERMNDVSLQEILTIFREVNPEATEIDDAQVIEPFSEEMKAYLKGLTEKRHADGRPILRLGGITYDFLPGKLIATITDSVNYVTALPYLFDPEAGQNIEFCSGPMEIRLKVSANSPWMTHGFDIEYPDDIIDVPIRMGLSQIAKAKDNGSTLRVPILKVKAPSTFATGIQVAKIRESEDAPIYLLESDDPEYADNIIIKADDGNDSVSDDDIFLSVGHVAKLEAIESPGDNDRNAFYIKFDEITGKDGTRKMFEFREGYSYTMKFDIEETGLSGFETKACPGQHIFTIKIVPEYLVWNGEIPSEANDNGKSLNWNNDANWSRVSLTDLYPGLDDNEKWINDSPVSDSFISSHTCSGSGSGKSNPGKKAFAPLDFTKVIIGNGKDFPHMYEISDEAVAGTDLQKHLWSRLPDFRDNAGASSGNNAPANGAGDPTPDIHYDMVAYSDIPSGLFPITTDGIGVGVSCRPWRANTAKEIHFRQNSEIFHQQHLRYERSWVEMEMGAGKWYTVSSPLRSVFAGDMYLPTLGARQVTPLFTGINFDNTLRLNDRFQPAVYQRSWNLASDKIYEAGGNVREGYVALDWSNVYNDVQVGYAPGEGFSIKTDVSEAEETSPDRNVLFRFPKDDIQYRYFIYEGSSSEERYKEVKHDVAKPSSTHGILNPVEGSVTVQANKTSWFFLVGNPFMAHIDMRKFLKRNEDKIEQKYWILNSNHQTVTIIDEYGMAITSDGSEDNLLLPPMTGFFVKSLNPVESLSLDYDIEMSAVVTPDPSKTWLDLINPTRDTRGATIPGILRITASTPSGYSNSILLISNPSYSQEMVSTEDAEIVVDPELKPEATIYSVADGVPLAINALPELSGTEIGVIADSGTDITLSFEGEMCNMGYYLEDRATGSFTPLTEGMRYDVTGSTAGRLFISGTAAAKDATEGIEIMVSDGIVSVTSKKGNPLDVTLCDTSGKVVRRFVKAKETVSFRPERGMSVVTATDGVAKAHRKIIL